MVNLAMHDALNNITRKYNTYALDSLVKNADPTAAVAQAAYDVLIVEAPWYLGKYDSLLKSSLSLSLEAESKTKGIAVGHAAASAIINKRINDGSANAQHAYVPGNTPGSYRFTAPFDCPPFNGLYAVPGWGDVKPFGLLSNSQFRPEPPFAVESKQYADDFNEVKELGSVNSTVRTTDQTHIALFWTESSPIGWNRIARIILNQNQNSIDAWKAARLFALLQLAEADAYISSCEAKTHYNYWRPITAIHEATDDGNPETVADSTWEVLAFPTPPIADYPSAHATAGGAAATVISNFFGTDKISFTTSSTTNAGVRSFNSLSQAALENGLSRVYIGYHFRNASMKGITLGNKVGDYIFNNYLQPIQ
jgi:hypothetical protein